MMRDLISVQFVPHHSMNKPDCLFNLIGQRGSYETAVSQNLRAALAYHLSSADHWRFASGTSLGGFVVPFSTVSSLFLRSEHRFDGKKKGKGHGNSITHQSVWKNWRWVADHVSYRNIWYVINNDNSGSREIWNRRVLDVNGSFFFGLRRGIFDLVTFLEVTIGYFEQMLMFWKTLFKLIRSSRDMFLSLWWRTR